MNPGGALTRGHSWLEAQRNPDRSLGYRPGQPGRPEPSLLVAAAGLSPPVAWLEVRDLGWAGRLAPLLLRDHPEADELSRTELGRLLEQRSLTEDGGDGFDTSLPAWGWVPATAGWTEPTAHALLALRAAGKGDHPRAAEAQRFLLDRQGTDGGWNYGNPRMLGQELASTPVPTGWALLALAGRDDAEEACERGLASLRAQTATTPSSHALALRCLAEIAMQPPPPPNVGAGFTPARITESARALAQRQTPEGHWFGRIDVTALACAALAASLGSPCPLLPEP